MTSISATQGINSTHEHKQIINDPTATAAVGHEVHRSMPPIDSAQRIGKIT
jgi:hypothetical protein